MGHCYSKNETSFLWQGVGIKAGEDFQGPPFV